MPYNPYGGGGMGSELLFLRQLFSSPNYMQVAMLAGILLVVIYRPERIHRTGMFRLSCVLLAVSIVVPSIFSAVGGLFAAAASGMGRGTTQGEFVLLLQVFNVGEPVLIALSICLGVFALLPPLHQTSRTAPAQHPLDS